MDLKSSSANPKSKTVDVPFYAVPDNIKTSSEIINEARASVRPIDTKRPFTPRDDQRRLFGNVKRHTRPPSACILENLTYDGSESRISTPTRLYPLLSKEKPKEIGDFCDSSPSSPSRQDVIIGRKINSAPGRVRLPSIAGNKSNLLKNLEKLPEEKTPSELQCQQSLLINKIAETTSNDKIVKRTSVSARNKTSSKTAPSVGLENVLGVKGQQIFQSVIVDESEEDYIKSKILPILDQIAYEKSTGDADIKLCGTIKKLYNALNDGHLLGKVFKARSIILRNIFKLFDSKNCSILSQAVRLCLAMNVTGNNLTSVSKVIFKITRNDKNDSLFLEDNILDILLQEIGSMNPLNDTEALIYCIGSLKVLALNLNILRIISNLKGVQITCNHVKQINDYKMSTQEDNEQISHVLFQLTGCLRNLAENTTQRKTFVTSGTVTELCRVMQLFPEDSDIMMNVARILSKLTMYYEVCNAMAENEICFPAMIHLLDLYRDNEDLVVRLCFAFGNAVAKNENARRLLFQQPNSMNILMDLLQSNVEKNVEFLDRQRDLRNFIAESTTMQAEETYVIETSEDIIIKTVRLLANMSIDLVVGSQIANIEQCLAILLTILGTKYPEKHEELIISALGTLSNLSYYSVNSQVFTEKLPDIVECTDKFLSSSKLDILIECLRILGNISRNEEVRKYLANMNVIDTAIKFLESDNKDIVYLSCGLLMNFMTEKSYKIMLNHAEGVQKMIEILKNFGSKDWQLASIICQTLWNYTCESIEFKDTLKSSEIAHLASLLQKYLDKNQVFGLQNMEFNDARKEIDFDIWQLEFCPVAMRLLNRMELKPYLEEAT